MVGQDRLVEQLNNTDIKDFPKSLILCGEVGCGKHTFCSLIEEKFTDWSFRYVDTKVDYDFVESCYLMTVPTFYIINSDNLTEREQNAILKLFEEPPSTANIILLSSSLSLLLPTIINRAVVWQFEKYSKEILKQFLNDTDVSALELVSTPGQLIGLTNGNYYDMLKLANLIIDKISTACISNALSLSKKFLLTKEDKEGFDIIVFTRLLRKLLFDRVKDSVSTKYVKAYGVTNEFYRNLLVAQLNKKNLFQGFVLSLKEAFNET